MSKGPPPQEQRRRKKRRPQPEGQKRQILLDLHLQVGLQDVLIRISPGDWKKILDFWIVGGEDIILRGAMKGQETDLIIRGSSGGSTSIRPADENKAIPRFQCIRVLDVKNERLEKQGI